MKRGGKVRPRSLQVFYFKMNTHFVLFKKKGSSHFLMTGDNGEGWQGRVSVERDLADNHAKSAVPVQAIKILSLFFFFLIPFPFKPWPGDKTKKTYSGKQVPTGSFPQFGIQHCQVALSQGKHGAFMLISKRDLRGTWSKEGNKGGRSGPRLQAPFIPSFLFQMSLP